MIIFGLLYAKFHFSLDVFSIFSVSLVLSNLIMMCLTIVLFFFFFLLRFHQTSCTHVGLWFSSSLEIFHPFFPKVFPIHPSLRTSIKCILGTDITKRHSRRTQPLFSHKSKQLDNYPWTKIALGGLRSSLKTLWQHSGEKKKKANPENNHTKREGRTTSFCLHYSTPQLKLLSAKRELPS